MKHIHILKKAIVLAVMPTLAALTLIGCTESGGEGSDSSTSSNLSSEVIAELSEEEQVIQNYERKLGTGEFTAQDYQALGELYAQQGLIRKQRDLLEQGWRLHGDAESFHALQTITVNIAEENDLIQKEAQRLYQNLELEEYVDEGVGMLISQGWFDIMMPKLTSGQRNYYLQTESGGTLYIQVGYDEDGQAFSRVWLTSQANEVSWVYQRGDMVQLLKTGLKGGQYSGAFDSWLCLSASGDVYHEIGSFENGVYVGDYTAQVHFGAEAMDLFALWSTRADLELTTYTGGFDADGITTVEQPDAARAGVTRGETGEAGSVAYAYDAEKTNYLFINAETADAALVFNTELMGISPYPVFTPYEVKEDTAEQAASAQIDAAQVQVRVYDGSLQWFDGTRWHTAGTVQEYIQADPFYGKEQPAAPKPTESEAEVGQTVRIPAYQRRGGGYIAPVQEYQEPTDESPQSNETPESGGGGTSGGGTSGGGTSGGGTSGGGTSGGGTSGGGTGNSNPTPAPPAPTPVPPAGDNDPDLDNDGDIEWSDELK